MRFTAIFIAITAAFGFATALPTPGKLSPVLYYVPRIASQRETLQ